jgi:hypothetical protein
MRSAERELLEIERKRQAADAPGGATTAAAKLKSAGDVARDRLTDLTKQIAEESKRLANTRSQLQKLKSTGNGPNVVQGNGTGVTVNAVTGATSSAGIMKAFLGGGGSSSAAAGSTSASAATTTTTGGGKGKKASLGGGGGGGGEGAAPAEGGGAVRVGAVAAVVPDATIPELCK